MGSGPSTSRVSRNNAEAALILGARAAQRCGAHAKCFDGRRCTLVARHDGWHDAAGTDGSRVRWNNAGSYEIEVPTKAAAP